MTGHRLEVADVVRRYGSSYLATRSVSADERRALVAIGSCRTAELGGHRRVCERCGHQEIAYNSCRNRSCPKCQGAARAQWLEAQCADLLDVGYFHVVFTLPHELGPLAKRCPRVIYNLLFHSATRTLLEIALDPRHLGAQIGILAVLHTWGQRLDHHPHLHCVVPGGGLAPDGSRWIGCRSRFFLPVKVLSRRFRTLFLRELRKAMANETLRIPEGSSKQGSKSWDRLLEVLEGKEWVVYAKPPFGGPAQVLKYLARYTHRVAISNRRLLALENDRVTFRWKDYANANTTRTLSLDAVEFLRRFLVHVLPSGFVHIRHYGFLANRHRVRKLERCRLLLGDLGEESKEAEKPRPESSAEHADSHRQCPACQNGRLLLVAVLTPWPPRLRSSALFDTS